MMQSSPMQVYAPAELDLVGQNEKYPSPNSSPEASCPASPCVKGKQQLKQGENSLEQDELPVVDDMAVDTLEPSTLLPPTTKVLSSSPSSSSPLSNVLGCSASAICKQSKRKSTHPHRSIKRPRTDSERETLGIVKLDVFSWFFVNPAKLVEVGKMPVVPLPAVTPSKDRKIAACSSASKRRQPSTPSSSATKKASTTKQPSTPDEQTVKVLSLRMLASRTANGNNGTSTQPTLRRSQSSLPASNNSKQPTSATTTKPTAKPAALRAPSITRSNSAPLFNTPRKKALQFHQSVFGSPLSALAYSEADEESDEGIEDEENQTPQKLTQQRVKKGKVEVEDEEGVEIEGWVYKDTCSRPVKKVKVGFETGLQPKRMGGKGVQPFGNSSKGNVGGSGPVPGALKAKSKSFGCQGAAGSLSPLSELAFYGKVSAASYGQKSLNSNSTVKMTSKPPVPTLKKKSASFSGGSPNSNNSSSSKPNPNAPKTRAAPTKAYKPLPTFLGGGRRIMDHRGQFILVDMSPFTYSPPTCPPVQWKGAPLTLTPTLPRFSELNAKEVECCEILRILPAQYLEIKETLLATVVVRGPYKKRDAQGWFRIDVNKTNKLYDW
ncbi:hypothetical protein HDV05_001937 [Chytridiales sp. JEL 0842]|nr:hypothetical protein HDV05_001937 [Chytridiales sp. JEL 0842]